MIVIKKIFEAVTYQNNYGGIAKGTLAKLSAQIGRNKEMPKDFTMTRPTTHSKNLPIKHVLKPHMANGMTHSNCIKTPSSKSFNQPPSTLTIYFKRQPIQQRQTNTRNPQNFTADYWH